ncbi:hypothetical protein Pve01_66950 [Planomonospora venezuelensis]|nr:hypothetical protein Pve01_66950 [Planomonospora venezuelensis]
MPEPVVVSVTVIDPDPVTGAVQISQKTSLASVYWLRRVQVRLPPDTVGLVSEPTTITMATRSPAAGRVNDAVVTLVASLVETIAGDVPIAIAIPGPLSDQVGGHEKSPVEGAVRVRA